MCRVRRELHDAFVKDEGSALHSSREISFLSLSTLHAADRREQPRRRNNQQQR